MVTVMEKIFRLSWANIRKHRLEAVSMLILVMLCMLLTGSSLSGSLGIRDIFPQMMEHTGSYENYAMIPAKEYDDEFMDYLKEDSRVEDCVRSELLFSMSTNFINQLGKEQALFMAFITQDNHAKLERSELETALTDAELAAVEHPLYMPYTARTGLMLKPGDSFDVVFGSKKFAFTVVGFYDTALFDTTGGGLKMVVTDSDYHALESVLDKFAVLAYNDHQGQGGVDLMESFINTCEDRSGHDIRSGFMGNYYEAMQMSINSPVEILLKILLVLAAVIILAVAFMIRFRIASDIKEQIISIGVLEALGYTSREITLSYVLEYLLISLAGILPGAAGCFVLTPLLYQVGETMIGHPVSAGVSIVPIVLTAAGILLFVAVIAIIRAGMVRNYPPVRAFRRGQGDHRFGKDYLPLRNTKHSVHIRLAMKGFFKQFRQNLGLTLCITVASIAIVFSFIMFTFFGMNMTAIYRSAGIELCDLSVELMPSEDADAFAEEMESLPEVRKALPTTSFALYVNAPDFNATMLPICFSDFDETENIFPADGRFPEHDNEVMLSNAFAKLNRLQTGDSIMLEYLNIKRSYVISGIVTSTTNGGINLYITEDGLRRMIPTYSANAVSIYLNEGSDAEEFRHMLTNRYGRSIADAMNDTAGEGSFEDRIRAEAEQQIAEMMAVCGATHVEYAIQVGDTVISGNSSNFRIRSLISMTDILKTQLSGISLAISAITVIFIILTSVVVMIILFILMESSVRKQRREFGIMKGMGYTSGELMFQLACKIMPAAIFSVIIGTVVGIMGITAMTSIVGSISINYLAVLLLDLALLAFCFGCAYIGARKIRKISVYELMTE